MSLKPRLSIIIPCYNMGNYVKDAVISVLEYSNQTDIEIIIVNDGSDDNGYTKNVLDGFNESNIKIIHQSNKGLSTARNIGIKKANSNYVLLLDADNKIRKDYISIGIEELDNNKNAAMVYGDLKKIGTKNLEITVGEFDITKVLVKNYIDACVVLRKSAWESVNGYDEKMLNGYEDWDFLMRLYAKDWRFKYVNKVLFDYRVRENSMLANSNKIREHLVNYIFSKPEYNQLTKVRTMLLNYKEATTELNALKNRRFMRYALKFENVLKRIFSR